MATLGTKYPYTLQVQQQPAWQMNALGDPVAVPVEWVDISCCRDEPSSGNMVSGVAATAIKYSSDIFCPVDCPKIADNALVRVVDGNGEVKVTGRVQHYTRYRHYVKLRV